MKKTILSILIILMLLSVNVFAENDTTENKTTNETTTESKEETPTSTKMNETMYVQERCNVRSSYSVDSDRVGGLDAGTEVTVIAEYSNGWYKIKYDGGEAYIKSGILRSTKSDSDENSAENETAEEKTTQNTTAEENTVEEKSTDEMDEEEADLMNEIGTLPEVGHNIANYLYIGIVIIAFIGTIYIVKKENN